MKNFAFVSVFLGIMALVACQAEQGPTPDPTPTPDPAPIPDQNQDFRASLAGTYLLHRLTQQGTVGQDTTTTFDGVEEMEITYDPSDSMLVYPGYYKLPFVAFGNRLIVALRESDTSFVEIQHNLVPGGQVTGGFIAPDSVYLYTSYVHGGTAFISEVLSGRKE